MDGRERLTDCRRKQARQHPDGGMKGEEGPGATPTGYRDPRESSSVPAISNPSIRFRPSFLETVWLVPLGRTAVASLASPRRAQTLLSMRCSLAVAAALAAGAGCCSACFLPWLLFLLDAEVLADAGAMAGVSKVLTTTKVQSRPDCSCQFVMSSQCHCSFREMCFHGQDTYLLDWVLD